VAESERWDCESERSRLGVFAGWDDCPGDTLLSRKAANRASLCDCACKFFAFRCTKVCRSTRPLHDRPVISQRRQQGLSRPHCFQRQWSEAHAFRTSQPTFLRRRRHSLHPREAPGYFGIAERCSFSIPLPPLYSVAFHDQSAGAGRSEHYSSSSGLCYQSTLGTKKKSERAQTKLAFAISDHEKISQHVKNRFVNSLSFRGIVSQQNQKPIYFLTLHSSIK
jgi:hypothetical protein